MNYISTIKVKLMLMFLLTFSTFYATASTISSTITGIASNIEAKHIGPAVGGAMFAIAIDPTDKNNIFFSGDMGVVYHTVDGGKSWSIVPGMYRIRSIKFDPHNTNIMWAVGSTGVYKSIDKGATWQYSFSTYHAFNFTLGAIAIDPTDSNIVYVAEGFVSYFRLTYIRGRVFKTTNGGKNWKYMRPGGDPSSDSIYNRNYSKILIDPNSSYTPGVGHSDVYLMGRDGLFKTTDAGNNWQNITFFDEGQGSDAILIDDNNQSTLIVSVIPMKNHIKQGVYKSTDNGLNWQEINGGLEDIIHALSIRNKDIRRTTQFSLMLANSASNKHKIYVGSWQGIAKNPNYLDQNWTQTTPAETPYIKHVSGAYVQTPLNTHPNQTKTFLGGIDNFIKMTVSDSDSNFVIFGDNRDIHFSSDGGTVWESRSFDYNTSFVNPPTDVLPTLPNNSPANVYTHSIKSRGVQGLVNNDIAVDPFNPQVYYATYHDVGLYVSRDAGKTWEHPTDGLPPRGHAWSVTVDPNNNGVVWVSMAQSGSVYKSTDHGVSWSDVSIDISSTGKVTDLLLDAQNSILYAATEYKGIFKSSDEGQTWQQIFTLGTFDIKIDLSNKNILYAGTKTGLYKSIDGGNSWNQLASDKMGKVYNISVGKNNTIYVISNKSGESYVWQNRKLWVSTDAGVNFNEITPSFMHPIGGVAVDPNNPQHIYISAYGTTQKYPDDSAIMAQSKDAGLTWEKLVDNFAFALGTDIYINPKNSNNIFFNTRFSLIEVNDNNTITPSPLTANAGTDMILNVTPSHRAVYLNGTNSSSSVGHNIISYKWYDNGTYIGSHATRWYVPDGSGVHDIKLVVKDDQRNIDEDHMNLTVNKRLKANAGQDINVAITPTHSSVTLDGRASTDPTNIVSYEWFDSAGVLLGTGATFNFIPPATNGAYPVTLTVKDGSGNSDSNTVIVNVRVVDSNATLQADAGSDITLNITPSRRAVYLNGSNSISTQGIVSYKWYDNDTYIGPNTKRWYVPNGTGSHIIKLIIKDRDGQESQDTMILTVNN